MTALQLLPPQDIQQEAREEGAGAERDHRQIEIDPEPEREPVVHVGLVQPFGEAEIDRIETDPEEQCPRQHPRDETSRRKSGASPRAISFYPLCCPFRRPVRKSLRVTVPLATAGSGAPGTSESFCPHPGSFRMIVHLGLRPEAGRNRKVSLLVLSRATALAGSARSPNTIACVGQASTQAGT